MRILRLFVLPAALMMSVVAVLPAVRAAQNPHTVVYQGDQGPGRGKHIVFIAGDEEYRSEESLPALARILARHYGFKATVFFTTDPTTGTIAPASSNIAGLEALKTADLLVIFTRFRDFPDAEMQHIVDYLDRGGPVVGLRTATHAFQIKRPDAKFLKYTWDNKDPAFEKGFGRQILGETWVTHYGTNHRQSSRLILQTDEASHPILRGVKDVWVQSGGYTADPIAGSHVLALGQILSGMTPDAAPVPDKKQMPVAWYRTYASTSGKAGRVFATTHGASEDLLNEGFRRMLVNACLWAAGLENGIQPNGAVDLVGPFHPSTFNFDGYVKGIRPADMAGWTSAIPATPRPQDQPVAGAGTQQERGR
ncbi:MAG: ThuA domain-containing protein [Vicinamibacterales bacterium]